MKTRIGLFAVAGGLLAAGTSHMVAAEAVVTNGYAIEPQFRLLRFGEVMPSGWIREQIRRDLADGFAGHMQELAARTSASQIFGAGRNDTGRRQNAGGQSGGGDAGMWWNGETEGNWRSGFTMMSLLAGTPEDRAAADARVAEILQTQDADGYLGIYGPGLRWPPGNIDNGELWTQTCLFRGLIAYAEATGRNDVLHAVERAVQLTMQHYRDGGKDPYGPGTMGHNLMFVDVVERLYELTGDPAYRDYGVYLYRNYSRRVGADISLANLLDPKKPLVGHGATTFEAFRAPWFAAYASGDPVLRAGADAAFAKAWRHVSPTGGPVSNELIEGKDTDPDTGGYECCGQKEWMTSLLGAAQKSGQARFADQAETTFYNSVQGARFPDGSGVDYITTDNLTSIGGTIANRCKYSPTHEDVANCCAPNFTQITPVFVRNMWMRAPDGLAAVLYGPCVVQTTVNGKAFRVTEETAYPFSEHIVLRVDPARPATAVLRLRVPAWAVAATVECADAEITRTDDWLIVRKQWRAGDVVKIAFGADVQTIPAHNGEFYLRRGPLFYALAIPAEKKATKDYPRPGFHDYVAQPVAGAHWHYALPKLTDDAAPLPLKCVAEAKADARYPWDGAPVRLTGELFDTESRRNEAVALVPMGSGEALLRRMTFPMAQ